MEKIIDRYKLPGDCSSKIVYRCTLNDNSTCIILDFSNIKSKSDEYFFIDSLKIDNQYDIFISMNNFLLTIPYNECRVPFIYDFNNVTKQIMMEDIGNKNLCQYGYNYDIYVKLVKWLGKLHGLYLHELVDIKNVVLARTYEVNAMRKEINEYYDNGGSEIIGHDELMKNISQIPYTICHRDFQTYNIMISDNGEPRVIDVQDLCVGPLTLDLAGIIYDGKLKVPKDDAIRLINLFANEIKNVHSSHYLITSSKEGETNYNFDQIKTWVRQCAVTRLIQSAGCHLQYYKENGKINHKQRCLISLNYLINDFSDIVKINKNDLDNIFK